MKRSRIFVLLLALLLAAGLSAPRAAADDAVRVSDAQSFLEAIAPGAVIELEPGVYNLSEAIASGAASSQWVSYPECWEGREVVVQNLDGLTIRGLGGVELVVEPRMADVLRFEGCSNITLSGMTLGHTIEPGVCTGAVLEFVSCSSVTLSDLDLYGCGTYGIEASYCSDLRMERSTIRECSFGILSVYDCRGFRFVDCELRDCAGYNMLAVTTSALSFDNCSFRNNSGMWDFISQTEGNSLRFYACRFDTWETAQLVGLEGVSNVSFDELCDFADTPGDATVTVTNEGEFFEAIRPGAVICLQPGRYDLGAWIAETWAAEGENWNSHHPFVRLQECYDGVEAVIRDADGLSILGLGQSRADTELIVEARYANVLAFENCAELALANLTLGHSEGGLCSGSVVALDGSNSVTLTNLDLYGCGTYGVYSFQSGSLAMRGCTVRDCSGGPVQAYGGWGDYRFEDCVFVDSDGGFAFFECPDVLFQRCVFGAKEYASIAFLNGATLEDCWH